MPEKNKNVIKFLENEKKVQMDHLAIACFDLESTKSFYTLLGLNFLHEEDVPSQHVKTAFAKIADNVSLELLVPLDNQGPIQHFLDKKGPGIHHICFAVENLKELMEKLKDKGIQLLYESPQKGAHNKMINFIHPKSSGGVLIELSEKK